MNRVSDEDVSRHLHLAMAASRRVYRRLPPGRRDLDAIESDALLGLFRGLQRFSEDRGCPLHKYLYKTAARQAWRGVRDAYALRNRRKRAMLDRTFGLDDLSQDGECLRRWREGEEREGAAEAASALLGRMPATEREWARAHYLMGVEMKELAAAAGCTKQNVSSRLKAAFRELR